MYCRKIFIRSLTETKTFECGPNLTDYLMFVIIRGKRIRIKTNTEDYYYEIKDIYEFQYETTNGRMVFNYEKRI